MHEVSLLRNLLCQVEQICKNNNGECVTAIHVELGPLSGVESLLLSSAFEQFAPNTLAEAAELIIDEVALEARCCQCDVSFEVADFCFRCPRCAATAVQVTRGDQFQLVSVSIHSNELSTGAVT